MTTAITTTVVDRVGARSRPKLLDVPSAAAYLGVSIRVIRDLRHQRLLPCVKVTNRVFFRPEDLDAYIAAQLQPALRGPLASGF